MLFVAVLVGLYLFLVVAAFASWFLNRNVVAAKAVVGSSEDRFVRTDLGRYLTKFGFLLALPLAAFYAMSVFAKGLAFVSWNSAGAYITGYVALLLIAWVGRNL